MIILQMSVGNWASVMIFTEQMTNDRGWLLAALWCNCKGWVLVHKLRSKCNPRRGHYLKKLFDILRLTQFFYFWISLLYLCREMFTGRCPNSNWGKWRWRPMGACNVKRVDIIQTPRNSTSQVTRSWRYTKFAFIRSQFVIKGNRNICQYCLFENRMCAHSEGQDPTDL